MSGQKKKNKSNENNEEEKVENGKTVSMIIPEDAEEGDVLTFNYNGTSFDIPIPEGSVAGDVLQIQIGGNDAQQQENEKEEEGSDIFELNLDEAVTLHFGYQEPQQKYQENKGEDEDDGTNAMCWPAGIHFSKYLYAHALTHVQAMLPLPSSSSSLLSSLNDEKRTIKVVELGSGQGIAALGFMAGLFKSALFSDTDIEVTLTDVPKAIPLLQHNWNHNKETILSLLKDSSTCNAQVHVKPLVWGDMSFTSDHKTSATGAEMNPSSNTEKRNNQQVKTAGYANVIIGSDLLYNSSKLVLTNLAQTMHTLLLPPSLTDEKEEEEDHGKDVMILLAVRWRKPNLERYFFHCMSDFGYDFTLLSISSSSPSSKFQQCPLSWEEYGNPDSEASNNYFTNTYIDIQKEQQQQQQQKSRISLKDITEEHLQLMKDEEYNDFERKQTQIYIGKRRKIRDTCSKKRGVDCCNSDQKEQNLKKKKDGER